VVLTPTLKRRRNVTLERYDDEIEGLYARTRALRPGQG